MAQINPNQIEPGSDGDLLRITDQKTQLTNRYGFRFTRAALPNACSRDGDDTGINLTEKPINYIMVFVDGKLRTTGNGETNKGCYFVDPTIGGQHVFAADCAGENGIAARKSDGSIWSWGLGNGGANGDNTTITRSSPVSVIGNHSFTALNGSGVNYKSGLKADGSVWSWGNNGDGNLGDQAITNKSSPVSVVGGHSFIKVRTSDDHQIGLKADGSVWGWGSGAAGRLGQGTTIVGRSSPVSIVGDHNFIDIMTGNQFSLALKADGTVWTWGNGSSGVLGDNATANRSSPVSVIGDHSFVKLAIDSSNGTISAALKADGSVWTWGENGFGELGISAANNRSSPVSVVGDHSFIMITTGFTHMGGLKADGSAWMWGRGNTGKTGLNISGNRSSPNSVVGGFSFIYLAATIGSTVAIRGDGTCMTWGDNTNGQLGDNRSVSRSSPISTIGPVGGPAKSMDNLVIGDRLIWNAYQTGLNLGGTEKIEFIFVA
jgi:alpha-tubulin suppressor-like RCC1 family protein